MLIALILAAAPAWDEPNSRELAVFPVTARLGVYQARQYGFAGDFYFPLARSFAVSFRGQYDYAPLARDESNLCDQTACRLELRDISSYGVLVTGAALLGFELRPEVAEPQPSTPAMFRSRTTSPWSQPAFSRSFRCTSASA